MKKLLVILISIFLFIPLISAKDVTIYLFHSDSCPHCKSEREFLNELELDNVNIKMFEVSTYSSLLDKVEKKLNIKSTGVPVTIIGSDYVVGFSDDIKEQILDMIDAYSKTDYCDAVNLIIENKDIDKCLKKNKYIYSESDIKFITILGHKYEFNAKNVSLPLISIIIGFVDGFNPCAMWVLIFLISMLISMKDRKKMWILGITFLVTSALVYLIFMIGILEIANIFSTIFKYIISVVAIVGGLLNLNSFRKSLKKDVGCQVTNNKSRKSIINKIKKIVTEKNFFLALVSIILLAISVNFIELACSSALPSIFISILSINDLSNFEYGLYMLLYILMFMIDDIVIFIIAMITFKVTGISNKYTKYSHLIGGIIMLIIGILMIFKMDWLMFNF